MNIIEKKLALAASYLKQKLLRLKYKGCKFGKKIYIKSGFRVLVENGAVLEIGDRTFFNYGCSITAQNRITIGKDCLFGEDVKIYDHNHVFKHMPTPIAEQGFSWGGVIVGNNVWVGSNVVLLKGCEIGDNSVIAAGAVVDIKVPSYSIYRRDGSIEKIVPSYG